MHLENFGMCQHYTYCIHQSLSMKIFLLDNWYMKQPKLHHTHYNICHRSKDYRTMLLEGFDICPVRS